MSKYFAVAIPASTIGYVMFFGIKIMDHANQNMFQIITNVLFGN